MKAIILIFTTLLSFSAFTAEMEVTDYKVCSEEIREEVPMDDMPISKLKEKELKENKELILSSLYSKLGSSKYSSGFRSAGMAYIEERIEFEQVSRLFEIEVAYKKACMYLKEI